MQLDEFLALSHRLADASGEVILPHFRAALEVQDKLGKSDFDPVTLADRAAEEHIRELIGKAFPDHGILGEEYGSENETSDTRWIVDPIDGTRAFIMGVPTWGTLIGLQHLGKPVLGMMNQPFTSERYWNDATSSHYRGPEGTRKLSTRACSSLDVAILASTAPELFKPGQETERFHALSNAVRMTRYGYDCYAYCLLAAGHIDVIAEAGLAAYDIAPLIPIIEKAGGTVTTWEGGDAAQGGQILASGDELVHEQALEILKAR